MSLSFSIFVHVVHVDIDRGWEQKLTNSNMLFFVLGVGFQCASAEGLLECCDALWDAPSGCIHHTMASQGLAREI